MLEYNSNVIIFKHLVNLDTDQEFQMRCLEMLYRLMMIRNYRSPLFMEMANATL